MGNKVNPEIKLRQLDQKFAIKLNYVNRNKKLIRFVVQFLEYDLSHSDDINYIQIPFC